WVKELMGITVPDVEIDVVELNANDPGKPKSLAKDRGSFLFAHFGLSGPAALNVIRAVSGHDHPDRFLVQCDFAPSASASDLSDKLQAESVSGSKRHLAAALAEYVPRRLADVLMQQAGLPMDRKSAGLSRAERERLVNAVKRTRIPVAGTMGFQKAEVT